MTIASTSRSNDQFYSSHTWFDDIFASYTVPAELGKEDVTDPVTGNALRLQSRYLGNAWMYCGSHSSQVMVYEIVQSQLADFIPDHHPHHHPAAANEQQQQQQCPTNSYSPVANIDQHTYQRSNSTSSHSSYSSSSGSGGEDSISALPPKKRRRRKVIYYQVIFSTLLSEDMTTHIDPKQNRYYLFPKEAILDTVNDMPPFEAYISFHLPDFLKEKRIAATVPPSEVTTTITTANANSQTDAATAVIPPISIRLSGMSKTLYVALKQTISEFENTYEKMMALMKLHKQQVSAQRFELDEEDLKFESIITQRINGGGGNGHHSWLASDDDEEELDGDVDIDEDGEIAGDDDYVDHTVTLAAPTRMEHSSHTKRSSSTTYQQPQSNTHHSQNTSTQNNSSSSTTSTTTTTTTNSSASATNGFVKQCLYCGSKTTPMWRRGPQGAGTLCNACGVKWKHGKILCEDGGYPSGTLPGGAKKKKKNGTSANTNNSAKRRKSATAATTTSAKKRTNDDFSLLSSTTTSTTNATMSSPQLLAPSPYPNHQRRHTTDMSSLLHNDSSTLNDFPSLNAVEEAAAVLTLLKRS